MTVRYGLREAERDGSDRMLPFFLVRFVLGGFVDRVFWAETIHEFTRTHTKYNE